MLNLGLDHWQGFGAGFDAALAGMAAPWLICVVLALTTLLLEDVAIAAGAALAAQGSLSWTLAFAAVAGGIAAGDVGLYALGLAARRVRWLQRRIHPERSAWAREQLVQRLPSAVLLARVIPGLRLLTYTACGWLRVPLLPFTVWVGVAVALWTAGLFWLSAAIGALLAETLSIPVPVAVALPILLLAAAIPLWRAGWRAARNRLQRKPT
jgi:membrane protein DedA with SNARE-associated domain